MALRRALQWPMPPAGFRAPEALEYLVSLGETTSGAVRSIVRSTTFDALGLTRTCCHHLEENEPSVIEDREGEVVGKIREEEQILLESSILDFLQKHWHPKVMDFLSQQVLMMKSMLSGQVV
ncbi:hypothetical protein BJY00DRAFT_289659 [Aspergillus carlsbadensis]|nr:hypothetical protein BJY00DRAFT_289659 [Aspergillus carlsbadensis]